MLSTQSPFFDPLSAGRGKRTRSLRQALLAGKIRNVLKLHPSSRGWKFDNAATSLCRADPVWLRESTTWLSLRLILSYTYLAPTTPCACCYPACSRCHSRRSAPQVVLLRVTASLLALSLRVPPTMTLAQLILAEHQCPSPRHRLAALPVEAE